MSNFKKLLSFKTLTPMTMTVLPVATVIGCSSKIKYSKDESFSDVAGLKKALLPKDLWISLNYGAPSSKSLNKIYDAIKANDSEDKFNLSFISGQKHTITNGIRSYDFLFVIDGHPSLNAKIDLSHDHEIHEKLISWFDNENKNIFEAWNEPNPTFDTPFGKAVTDGLSIREQDFDHATSVIIYSHDRDNKQIGYVCHIKKANNKTYISEPVTIFREFEQSLGDAFCHQFWSDKKKDSKWQNENKDAWDTLKEMAINKDWK